MIIGFNKQFPDKIIKGTKKHTIREDKHDRWHAGMKMHMATGVRTKKQNCFKLDICNGVQNIIIIWDRSSLIMNKATVYIDNKNIGGYFPELKYFNCTSTIEQLAKNDGFYSVREFFAWFDENFTGKLIHWTDLRY